MCGTPEALLFMSLVFGNDNFVTSYTFHRYFIQIQSHRYVRTILMAF